MSIEFSLRPYERSDAPQVVALVNVASMQTMGTRRAVVDGTGNVRLARYVPVGSEKVVAIDACGEVVGYAYFVPDEYNMTSQVGGFVRGRVLGQGIGALLLEWAERRALMLARNAPAGVKTVLQANLFEAEQAARQLLDRWGFAPVRTWVHLAVELVTPPPLPAVSTGLHIRAMDLENDWDIVGPAMDEAFADHWGAITLPAADAPPAEEPGQIEEQPEDESYSNAPGFCFIALDGETVAGGILCNAKVVERDDTGRVGSLFVRPSHRRQGVGRDLMLTAFQAFWQRGLQRIITDTDMASFTNAPKLYEGLGMRLYRREFLYEKEIRPGIEIRRLDW